MGFGTVDGVGKDFVESEKVRDGNVGKDDDNDDDENEVVMCEKEVSEVYFCEGGGMFSDPKGVNLVVDLDACVRQDKEGGEEKGGFRVNDLVWAKVRSHPWWPGQIFEPVDASDDARKRFRFKSHLVAYFGDHTFAWNDDVKLKPFLPHFTKMVKQTSKESFRHAVDCVLDEVSRRVEFGLSCGCIKDVGVYDRLKTQVIYNAGIRELSSKRECGDRFLTVSSFNPLKFFDYVKSLALEPFTEVDRLEYVMAKGQMSALYRYKGCYHLAEFGSLIGQLSNEADSKNPILEKEATCEMSDHLKRKITSGGSRRSSKKVKRVSDLMVKKGSKKEGNENEIEGNIVNMSSSYAPKRKVVRTLIDEVNTEDYSLHSQATETVPRDSKQTFSVGASILRVADQLNQPSKEKAFDSEITTISKCGDLGQISCPNKPVDVTIPGDEDSAVLLLETEGANLSSKPRIMPESVASESSKSDEKLQEDESPTALTLKFTDIDSIPSEPDLHKIFSQFGPLKESETEVLTKKNCARVVFKRRVDADAAFSSSGKFETFGPSLVCYQLNYAPSLRKPLSVEAKRRKKR